MQGKNYLRQELSKLANIELTNGGETANRRIDFGITKEHSNDAIVITGLRVTQVDCNIKDYIIKPLRTKKESKTEYVLGFKHRDVIKYTKKNGEFYIGYIVSLDEKRNSCNFMDFNGKIFSRYGLNRCKLIQRAKGIIFI